ncbi:hypothetical protein ENBRE01_0360 [Enteropsectra breve]|nr:hypothetical protein ENBRE01_0360 [Enteropsectra breve]
MKITVNDKMQTNYKYETTKEIGDWADEYPDFKPAFTPIQMLNLGVFEGKYMNDCVSEFGEFGFFDEAKTSDIPDERLNFFKIKSRMSLGHWKRKGWIYKDDPRGWFQWYCRFYIGRRIPDEDDRQIKRWKAFKRHMGQVVKNCKCKIPHKEYCRPRQRQGLLQWSYDSISELK